MSVGNIFDGYYTNPYGAGTPPGGRASGDIWSGVYDYGDYDYGGGMPRPAPPEEYRPAPPRGRPAPPIEGIVAAVRAAVANMTPDEKVAIRAKLSVPSSDGSLAGDIAAAVGRHHHHKHKKHKKQQQQQDPGDGGGGDDGGGGIPRRLPRRARQAGAAEAMTAGVIREMGVETTGAIRGALRRVRSPRGIASTGARSPFPATQTGSGLRRA